jgi:GT2 family glycosyltransferase
MEFDQGTRLDRLMKVRSPHPGQVLKSGENIGFGDPKKPYFVDWLPGCSMSFRSSIFTHLQFSSEFGFWGEDVHFSLKVQKFGKLMVFPVANLVHYKSASNRNSEIKRRWLQFVSRVKLHREFPEKISLFWVVISTLYQNTRYNLHHLKHFLKFSSNYLPLKYVRKIVFTFKKARRKIGFRVSL